MVVVVVALMEPVTTVVEMVEAVMLATTLVVAALTHKHLQLTEVLAAAVVALMEQVPLTVQQVL